MDKTTLANRISLALLSFIFFSLTIKAQVIFFNNGAQIYSAPNSIIKINGGFRNDGANGVTPVFDHNGTMTVANSGTQGTVYLKNSSTLQGNGTYRVEQDWINDAVFTANNSTVELYGNSQQYITSTTATVTTFNNLTLTGTGAGNNRKKTLSLVDANIGTSGILTINDRELETLTNTMYVFNTSTTCVTNNTTYGSEGFVSSDVGGALSRATASASAYIYPTGSSKGTLRYRPAILTPATASANTYDARLGNNDATNDGFNTASLGTNLGQVNQLFYHQINRTAGIDNSNIDIFYDPSADGLWDGMGQWNTPTTIVWNDMGTVALSTGTNYNDVLKVNWSDFTNSPYILARRKPTPPQFACAPLCANSEGNLFSINGSSSGTYNWIVTGGTITSGQGTGTVTVDWGAAPGTVCVTSSSALGIPSDSVCCIINLAPSPNADFSYTGGGLTYNFTDLSTGAISWDWGFFGNGSTSNQQNPSFTFNSNGIQNVCLTVQNSYGCIDSVCKSMETQEFFVLPNVFTPNEDGDNDFWYVHNSGMEKFRIEIYNRWGLLLYESESAEIKWDGRTNAGVQLNDGTYYYILNAISLTGKNYSTKGYIQLLREKAADK